MTPLPEWNVPFAVQDLGDAPLQRRLAADATTCRAIARRLGLLELASLDAKLTLRRARDDAHVAVTGMLHATLQQQCVVTLEPLPVTLDAPVDSIFGPPPAAADPGHSSHELDLTLDGEDDVEPIEDGTINLGELVVQCLSLALDPWPRKAGAVFEAPAGTDTKASPFAILANYRKK